MRGYFLAHPILQQGQERDAISGILQVTSRHPELGIRSAFCRDSIQGSIYVEAHKIEDVQSAWAAVLNIPSTRRLIPKVSLVPLSERVDLLNMKMADGADFKLWTWVRIRRAGKYKNDIGLVCGVKPATRIHTIKLVPRLNLDRKRKREARASKRPPPSLFDPKHVREVCGAQAVQEVLDAKAGKVGSDLEDLREVDKVWKFRGIIYKNGLIEVDFPYASLNPADNNLSETEFNLFAATEHPDVINALQDQIVLKIGDRIQVAIGTYRGASGHLVDIREDGTILLQPEGADHGVELLLSDAQKYFKLGDFVHVTRGAHIGKAGHITSIEDGGIIGVYYHYKVTPEEAEQRRDDEPRGEEVPLHSIYPLNAT